MKENMAVIRDPKTFCFNFDWPKNDENLKHEIEFIIKSYESLAKILQNHYFAKMKVDSYNSLPIEKILTLHVIILSKAVLNKDKNH